MHLLSDIISKQSQRYLKMKWTSYSQMVVKFDKAYYFSIAINYVTALRRLYRESALCKQSLLLYCVLTDLIIFLHKYEKKRICKPMV